MPTFTISPTTSTSTVRYEPCSVFQDDPTAPNGECAGCGWLAHEHAAAA